MPPYGITHESGPLKRVLVHHPGRELELANSDPAEHNFEQPVNVDRFIADHRSLMDALIETGVEVLDVGTLLKGSPTSHARSRGAPISSSPGTAAP